MKIELAPFFQPIINVESGLIAYNEVLARKQTISGDFVSAGAIFSSPNLSMDKIINLDNQVRNKAFQKYRDYKGNAQLTINISPSWFNRHARNSKQKMHEVPTLSMLRDCGIDPRRIVIELTEYDGNKEMIQHFVHSYREMGMKVAIDDFGSGFSQIDRLIAIEPDIIKLDMNLFQHSLISSYALDFIQVIASFAKKRGTELIFEGVETPEQFDIAVSSGADFVQGYLFSHAEAEFFNDNVFVDDIRRLKNIKIAV
ncbi:MAG: EAL domain-containing protein (putative c-di-GMP-specific phosphodiesterase class I) [Psychromonas sp.]|jgi:EAL domain-containing protein (putative c-di-GMP-specific phosphodiesterase class I)|uniref:EAL domain-containing protein n=1 Tax=Psychromonas sp. TaxID=1884585 RepID=UPI0039E27359